tara:strand:- start:23786 stop:24406 length:621 start_codon:yes stop_codon:yes gene_type:complete
MILYFNNIMRDTEKFPTLSEFNSKLEKSKAMLNQKEEEINKIYSQLYANADAGNSTIDKNKLNQIDNSLKNFERYNISNLSNKYKTLFSKNIEGNFRVDSKKYQDIANKEYNNFYRKSLMLDLYQKRLNKLKQQYISAEAALQASIDTPKLFLSIFWGIITVILVILTIMAFMTRKIHPITWVVVIIFLHAIILAVIKNIYAFFKK